MLVSIIITSHNYERYLPGAINSALGQDYPQVEVIVVDDGSGDGSQQVIESYGDRVIPIIKENGGQCSSFNAGFARCRGDVVVFLDADDELLEHAASRHVERLRHGAVKSCGYMEVIDAHGHPTGSRIPRRLPESGDYFQETLTRGLDAYQTSFTSGHAWSREFLEQVLPLPEDSALGPDGYLTAIDRFFGRLEFIHEPVARYRVHTDNKGPAGFRFDTAHLADRIRRKQHRLGYAETWLARLGHGGDHRELRQIRDWRFLLMMHSLSLMKTGEPSVPGFELVSSPFRASPERTLAATAAACCLLLIRLLPRNQALALAHRVLDRTRIGQSGARRRVATGRRVGAGRMSVRT